MDGWKRTYTYFGFEGLDLGWERVIVYGAAVAFWINLAAWLISREGIIPGVGGPFEWLLLALLAVPGTVRTAFLIALGPARRGEWSEVWESPEPEPAAAATAAPTEAVAPAPEPPTAAVDAPASDGSPVSRRWWRLRMRVRREFTRNRRPRLQPKNTRSRAAAWSKPPGAGQSLPSPLPGPVRPPLHPPAQAGARPRQGGSAAGTVVKILAVLACSQYAAGTG